MKGDGVGHEQCDPHGMKVDTGRRINADVQVADW
jgi:hypothetical protein